MYPKSVYTLSSLVSLSQTRFEGIFILSTKNRKNRLLSKNFLIIFLNLLFSSNPLWDLIWFLWFQRQYLFEKTNIRVLICHTEYHFMLMTTLQLMKNRIISGWFPIPREQYFSVVAVKKDSWKRLDIVFATPCHNGSQPFT